jgi:hypothetical protein
LAKLTLPAPTRCIKELLAVVSPPSSSPLFGGADNVHSMHTVSSPTVLVHAVCQALKAWPLPTGPVGSKDAKGNGGKDDGDTGVGSQVLDHALDQDGPPLSTPRSSMTAMRKVSK